MNMLKSITKYLLASATRESVRDCNHDNPEVVFLDLGFHASHLFSSFFGYILFQDAGVPVPQWPKIYFNPCNHILDDPIYGSETHFHNLVADIISRDS